MAERNSWAISAVGGVISVEDARVAIGSLMGPGASNLTAKSGFRPGAGTSPGLVTATGTPDGYVHVSPFQGWKQTSRATTGGAYIWTLDAIKDINVLSTPAHATNPRDDLIIVQQSDMFYSDLTNVLTVKQVVGTPAAVPTDPVVTGSPDYIVLARVRVAANATTITGGNITDLRPSALYSVALGGVLPVASATARNTLSGYDGMHVYRQDRNWTEAYDGGAWRVLSLPVVTSVADLASISDPYLGLAVFNSGDGQTYTYNAAGAWVANIMFARKTGDETVSSSATMQDDDHLVIPLAANTATWIDVALIHSVAGTIVDIKFDQSFPAGAEYIDMGAGPEVSLSGTSGIGEWGANAVDTSSPSTARAYGDSGGNTTTYLTGICVTGGTAGNWRLRFAQANSNATPVILRKHSSARAMRMTS